MTIMVYLAEPIDQAMPMADEERQLRYAAESVLRMTACTVYRPSRAYEVNDGLAARQVYSINQHALATSDAIVAILPTGVPTLGVPTEIEQALLDRTSVFIVVSAALAAASVQIQAWEQRGAWVWAVEGEADQAICEQWAEGLTKAIGDENRFWQYQITRRTAGVWLPDRTYPDDAGLDLAATQEAVVPAGGRAVLHTGIAGALPVGTWGLILGRSSSWVKRGLVVIPAVIDVGWRGELDVCVYNPGSEAVVIKDGERVGQIIVLPAWQGQVQEVRELPPHPRGLNGWGSSDAAPEPTGLITTEAG